MTTTTTVAIWSGQEAVLRGESYGLYEIKNNHPQLGGVISDIYSYCESEFENPKGVVFSVDLKANIVMRHTCFSKAVADLVYYGDINNLPVRSIENGVGSSTLAAIYFALYAVSLYTRLDGARKIEDK